jgi:multidrug resistance efflux pump
MISKEVNSRRKSHRVTLPLFVEIDGNTYAARNWSITGIGITGLNHPPEKGATIPARLIFSMIESTLTLKVQLTFKSQKGDSYGFEFHELSARNKRVLRHYIELAVEGKLENLEDVVAISTTPDVLSPIEDALNLTEIESEGILKEFKKNSYLAVLFGVLLLITVTALLFYNTVYKIEATGFISGNTELITANGIGRIHSIAVEPNTFVDKGVELFSVEDPDIASNIADLEEQIRQLGSKSVPHPAMTADEANLIASLKQELDQRKLELENAEHLYSGNVISIKDLYLARNRHTQIRTEYLREVSNSSDYAALRQNTLLLFKLRSELAAKQLLRRKQVSSDTVRSLQKGKIFQIDKSRGEYVLATDPVMIMELDVVPYVLVRLRNDDILKLHIGMLADIYVPFEDRKYQATISAIGLSAINASISSSIESSGNETVVKLEFENKQVRLPANSRVKVWIKTLGST